MQLNQKQVETILNEEVLVFFKTNHGVVASGDMQTLAKFVQEHSKAIADKLNNSKKPVV